MPAFGVKMIHAQTPLFYQDAIEIRQGSGFRSRA